MSFLTIWVDDRLRSVPENQPFYVLTSDKKDHGVFRPNSLGWQFYPIDQRDGVNQISLGTPLDVDLVPRRARKKKKDCLPI